MKRLAHDSNRKKELQRITWIFAPRGIALVSRSGLFIFMTIRNLHTVKDKSDLFYVVIFTIAIPVLQSFPSCLPDLRAVPRTWRACLDLGRVFRQISKESEVTGIIAENFLFISLLIG